MQRHIDRAGRVATVVAGSLLLGACNVKHELLAPQNPGVIDPGSVANGYAAGEKELPLDPDAQQKMTLKK